MKELTADERERENLIDILQVMAVDSIHSDGEIAELMFEAAKRVAGGGSMSGLTQRAYWCARPCWTQLVDAVSLRAVLVRGNGLCSR